jgi:hypothetical protein
MAIQRDPAVAILMGPVPHNFGISSFLEMEKL